MLCNNNLFDIQDEDDETNINTIFQFICTPNNFINNNEKIKTIKKYNSSIEYFINHFGDINLTNLFINLLKFNPKERISANDALNHIYFSN
jgi:hypothetical protein